ncbi:uncharacterized protein LOC144716219 [Wolffia australiana]
MRERKRESESKRARERESIILLAKVTVFQFISILLLFLNVFVQPGRIEILPTPDYSENPFPDAKDRNSTMLRSNGQAPAIDSGRKEMSVVYDNGGRACIFGDFPRGPRGNRRSGDSSSSSSLSLSSSSSPFCIDSRDKYNRPDFETSYENAKFFVIRSFNEDDIHKSIKYSVWASTHYGNQKLDRAFRESVARLDDGIKYPVFLFFSVNGSGQFVGLAEMLGPVDFIKTMNFWQEDKWRGFFPVKWHIIKDIPGSLFRGIILENNDNKPVIVSRDTQEVGIHHGLKMLRIFKDFEATTCLLDDFTFYEQKERYQKVHKKTAARILPTRYYQDHPEPMGRGSSKGFEKGYEGGLAREERNRRFERGHESGLAREERNRGFERGHEIGLAIGERNREFEGGYESGLAREEKNREFERGYENGLAREERSRGFERGYESGLAREERNRGFERGYESGLERGERNRGSERGYESGFAREERNRGFGKGHESGFARGERNRGFERRHERGLATEERMTGFERGHERVLAMEARNRDAAFLAALTVVLLSDQEDG